MRGLCEAKLRGFRREDGSTPEVEITLHIWTEAEGVLKIRYQHVDRTGNATVNDDYAELSGHAPEQEFGSVAHDIVAWLWAEDRTVQDHAETVEFLKDMVCREEY